MMALGGQETADSIFESVPDLGGPGEEEQDSASAMRLRWCFKSFADVLWAHVGVACGQR